MGTALPPRSLAQTRPCLQSLHSPALLNCRRYGCRATGALCSDTYCKGCLRVMITTCTPALPVPPPAFALSTMCTISSLLLLYSLCAMCGGHMEAMIPMVPPPRSHCRIDSSELPGSAMEPTSLSGSTGAGSQAGGKGRSRTRAQCAVLCWLLHHVPILVPPHQWCCALSILWAGWIFCNRKNKLRGPLTIPVCLPGAAENHRAGPSFGSSRLPVGEGSKQPWELSSSGCPGAPPALPTVQSNQGAERFTASLHPLPYSSSSSKQAPHTGSRESTKQAGQLAEASAPTPCHQPCSGTCKH